MGVVCSCSLSFSHFATSSTSGGKSSSDCVNYSLGVWWLKFLNENIIQLCQPIFHDGMKEWSCCKQRSHDFSLFLAIPGYVNFWSLLCIIKLKESILITMLLPFLHKYTKGRSTWHNKCHGLALISFDLLMNHVLQIQLGTSDLYMYYILWHRVFWFHFKIRWWLHFFKIDCDCLCI